MQNVAVLFEQAAEQFAAAYPENGPLSPWITEQLGVTEPYLRGKAGVALLLLRLVQRQLTGNSIPLCRDMLPIEDRAAAVPELESVQIWWHRWLGYRHGLFRLGKFVAGSRRGVAAAAGNTAGTLLCRDSAEI